jgi:DNA-binding IclR family transcriptional regulator
VAGAISVTGLKPRDWSIRLAELGARVRHGARSVSRQLGYSGA